MIPLHKKGTSAFTALIGPDGLIIERGTGRELEALASEYWENCGKAERRQILWDVPWNERRDFLENILAASDLAFGAWLRGRICGLSWIVANGKGSRLGMIHFSLNREVRPYARLMGKFILDAAEKCGFACLTCLIPTRNWAARRFVRELGFQSLAIMPCACWVWELARPCDGELFYLRFENDGGAEAGSAAWLDTGCQDERPCAAGMEVWQ